MNFVYIFLLLFLAVMVFIYFIPYRSLRGKIFNRVIWKEPSKLTSIGFVTSSYSIKLERNENDHWNYIIPDRWDADDVKVRRLIMRLAEMKVSTRHSGKNDAHQLEVGKYGELELEYGSDIILVAIGGKSENGELVYIKSSTEKDVLGVSATLLTALPKNIDDFKDMLLFNQYYSNISGIEIRFNEKSFVMSKTDEGWMMNGNNVFDENAKPVIEKLLNSTATGFAKDGIKIPAKPIGIITVKLADGDLPITRFFFEDDLYPTEFLMPSNSKVLLVSREFLALFNM